MATKVTFQQTIEVADDMSPDEIAMTARHHLQTFLSTCTNDDLLAFVSQADEDKHYYVKVFRDPSEKIWKLGMSKLVSPRLSSLTIDDLTAYSDAYARPGDKVAAQIEAAIEIENPSREEVWIHTLDAVTEPLAVRLESRDGGFRRLVNLTSWIESLADEDIRGFIAGECADRGMLEQAYSFLESRRDPVVLAVKGYIEESLECGDATENGARLVIENEDVLEWLQENLPYIFEDGMAP